MADDPFNKEFLCGCLYLAGTLSFLAGTVLAIGYVLGFGVAHTWIINPAENTVWHWLVAAVLGGWLVALICWIARNKDCKPN